MDMGVWDFQNVVCRPGRNGKGEYWPAPVSPPEMKGQKIVASGPMDKSGYKQLYLQQCKRRGMTDEQAEERWRNSKHGRSG